MLKKMPLSFNAKGFFIPFAKFGKQYIIICMYEVRVEADFAAAHFLRDYNGKCENLHGHNYRVLTHARSFPGAGLNQGGMLFDFSRLKAALRAVCKELDHTNLNDMEYFDQNPSAERIATYIYSRIVGMEPSLAVDNAAESGVLLFAVDVYETPGSRARFIPDQVAALYR